MPDWADDDDDWEDNSDEEEFADDEEEEPTVPCPYCRRTIHEDSPQCPHCGNYLSAEDSPPSRKPWWIILGVLVCLVLVYLWMVG